MKILIVSATQLELARLRQAILQEEEHEMETLITGVGMIATSFALTKKLISSNFDLAINIGVAGAFDRELKLGEVIEVAQDQFAEELIEDGNILKSYAEIGLRDENEFPFSNGILHSNFLLLNSCLKKVNSITVNTVHGNENSIQDIEKRLNPQTESMEGAAFFYVCHQEKVPCLQIRAISNYVEKRNRVNWEIELALNNLAKEFQTILKQL